MLTTGSSAKNSEKPIKLMKVAEELVTMEVASAATPAT